MDSSGNADVHKGLFSHCSSVLNTETTLRNFCLTKECIWDSNNIYFDIFSNSDLQICEVEKSLVWGHLMIFILLRFLGEDYYYCLLFSPSAFS